jgi:hypothetical protein
VTGAPDAEPAPPRSDNSADVPCDLDSSRQAVTPSAARTAGVTYQFPGAAFLDSMLLQFHTMVARALAGNGEVSRF